MTITEALTVEFTVWLPFPNVQLLTVPPISRVHPAEHLSFHYTRISTLQGPPFTLAPVSPSLRRVVRPRPQEMLVPAENFRDYDSQDQMDP